MKATHRAYMAGILDGEGCVYVNRRKATGRRKTPGYGVKVCVSTTDKSLVDWMESNARLTSIYYNDKVEGNRKPKWQCTWNNSAAEWLLNQTMRYLVIKTPQAELGLELLKHLRTTPAHRGQLTSDDVVAYRETIKARISKLNQRGRIAG